MGAPFLARFVREKWGFSCLGITLLRTNVEGLSSVLRFKLSFIRIHFYPLCNPMPSVMTCFFEPFPDLIRTTDKT